MVSWDGAHADDLAGGTGDRVDDAPPAKLTDGIAGAQELAGEVNGEHRVPLIQRHLVERCILLNAGVVNEDVDGSELFLHPSEHLPDVFFVRDVNLVAVRPDAQRTDLLDDFLRRLFARAPVDHHICSCAAEGDGHRPADAGVGAGNQSLLALDKPRDLAARLDYIRYL